MAAYGNRAQCKIKLEEFQSAWTDCNAVLTLEPSNVKAWIRRGSAKEGMGLCVDALEDYREAQLLEPKNKAAADALARLSTQLCEGLS